jgi:uncharacterized protein (DUF1330 family)
MVTAYAISEVRIVDPASAQRYMRLAEASIGRHGGHYLVRAADPTVPEGEWDEGRRVVVVEFSSMERLRQWYASDDYAEALALSSSALDRRLIFVPGYDGD